MTPRRSTAPTIVLLPSRPALTTWLLAPLLVPSGVPTRSTTVMGQAVANPRLATLTVPLLLSLPAPKPARASRSLQAIPTPSILDPSPFSPAVSLLSCLLRRLLRRLRLRSTLCLLLHLRPSSHRQATSVPSTSSTWNRGHLTRTAAHSVLNDACQTTLAKTVSSDSRNPSPARLHIQLVLSMAHQAPLTPSMWLAWNTGNPARPAARLVPNDARQTTLIPTMSSAWTTQTLQQSPIAPPA